MTVGSREFIPDLDISCGLYEASDHLCSGEFSKKGDVLRCFFDIARDCQSVLYTEESMVSANLSFYVSD